MFHKRKNLLTMACQRNMSFSLKCFEGIAIEIAVIVLQYFSALDLWFYNVGLSLSECYQSVFVSFKLSNQNN